MLADTAAVGRLVHVDGIAGHPAVLQQRPTPATQLHVGAGLRAATATTVRAECCTTGDETRDDNLVYSNRWVRMGRGYMNTLYFEGYRDPDAMLDGLPAC